MYNQEKFNETLLPEKKKRFLQSLKYKKRVCKDFETKHLGEYHDLYV